MGGENLEQRVSIFQLTKQINSTHRVQFDVHCVRIFTLLAQQLPISISCRIQHTRSSCAPPHPSPHWSIQLVLSCFVCFCSCVLCINCDVVAQFSFRLFSCIVGIVVAKMLAIREFRLVNIAYDIPIECLLPVFVVISCCVSLLIVHVFLFFCWCVRFNQIIIYSCVGMFAFASITFWTWYYSLYLIDK